MRRRELTYSLEVFTERLRLPADCVVTGVEVNARQGTVSIMVSDPTMSPLPEGATPYPETMKVPE
jgi:hypothetical protein